MQLTHFLPSLLHCELVTPTEHSALHAGDALNLFSSEICQLKSKLQATAGEMSL